MDYYHFSDPDGYYNVYKREVDYCINLMVTLDRALIHSNLPPVGKTKDLFDMVEALSYSTYRRYEKENGIEKGRDDVLFMSNEKLVDKMKTMLQEEVARCFNQGKENEWYPEVVY